MLSGTKKDELRKLMKKIHTGVKDKPADIQADLDFFFGKEPARYTQNWPMYAQANSQEKLAVLNIIKKAVDHLCIHYKYTGTGRPPVHYADILKCLLIKSYHGHSSWRSNSDFQICKAMGIIDTVPKKSTINKYMKDKKITQMLRDLVLLIAQPLAQVETHFAIDATGISSKYGNARWQTIKHTPADEEKRRREYKKLHIICGCKTNVVCAVEVTPGNYHESPYLKKLLKELMKNFKPKHICADAGYLSKKNVKLIRQNNAHPWIMPKKNVGGGPYNRGALYGWRAMLYIWHEHRAFFAQHYHQRSNVESTFSALKRKFGDYGRCKLPETAENEILCKVVCFNACILAESLLLFELERTGFVATL